jgi:hypothetical protein
MFNAQGLMGWLIPNTNVLSGYGYLIIQKPKLQGTEYYNYTQNKN